MDPEPPRGTCREEDGDGSGDEFEQPEAEAERLRGAGEAAEPAVVEEPAPRTPPTRPQATGAVDEAPPMPGPGADSGAARRPEVDPMLGSLSMPAAVVRRIARSAAPGVRFSPEALAAIHRVGQAFVLFATDRSVRHMQGGDVLGPNGKPLPKKKGAKPAPAPKKTLGIDHVMQFLSAEVPNVATKVSTLFPDLVPSEYRPESVRLLEMIRAQEKAKLEGTPLEEVHGFMMSGDAQPPEGSHEGNGAAPEAARKRLQRNSSGDVGSELPGKKRSKTEGAGGGGGGGGGGLTALFGRQRQAAPAPATSGASDQAAAASSSVANDAEFDPSFDPAF